VWKVCRPDDQGQHAEGRRREAAAARPRRLQARSTSMRERISRCSAWQNAVQ
jgi:hypothetical protein